MYGLIGDRLRHWLEANKPSGEGEEQPAAEPGLPTPRLTEPALSTGDSDDGQTCAAAPKTDSIAISITQKVCSGGETPSGVRTPPEVGQITK